MMRRQDQEAAVVGDQMETVVLITGRPANPAIPRRALPGRCGEAQQGQPLRVMPRHIPQGMADLRQRPQVMMGLHQRLEARLISGAINGTYGDLAKVQIATLVGPTGYAAFCPSVRATGCFEMGIGARAVLPCRLAHLMLQMK